MIKHANQGEPCHNLRHQRAEEYCYSFCTNRKLQTALEAYRARVEEEHKNMEKAARKNMSSSTKINKVFILVSAISAGVLLVSEGVFAEDANQGVQNGLLMYIEKFERMIEEAQKEILATEANIRRADEVIALAREEDNAEAEAIARKARGLAIKAKEKSSMKKKMAEQSIESARKILANNKLTALHHAALYCEGDVWLLQIEEWQSFKTEPTEPTILLMPGDKAKTVLQFGNCNLPTNLMPGDKVKTGINGRIDLLLADAMVALVLGPDSELHLIEKKKSGVGGAVRLFLLKGKMFFQKLIKGNFEVKTLDVSIGVRGTKFILQKSEEKGTEVIVLEGIVEATDAEGKNGVEAREGYRIHIPVGGIPSKPEKIDPGSIRRWWEESQAQEGAM